MVRDVRRRALALLVPLSCVLGLLLPSAAGALTVELVNESGRSADDVWITVAGADFAVPGMTDDQPVRLSAIPGQRVSIDRLVSGRIYVAYGAPVRTGVTFDSPTRFDWAELTVIPNDSDVANLTAVDQFAIGMRLDTLDRGGRVLETVGSANSAIVFDALQRIPGGPQATVRDGAGDVLRVLSPLHSRAYPDLGDYVRSLAGQRITLRTAFFGAPFTTSVYSGTFAADGSITLAGTSNPAGGAPASFALSAGDMIDGIATGANTPNTLQGAITRDLLAGFSVGLWGGRYGNDALGFCRAPVTTEQGTWCPRGFDQPAFGDARTRLAPFATCEQYAAVVNARSDVYGNPYTDTSKRVTVSLDQPATGGSVETLRLTILPDTGTARPVAGGDPDCGAAVSRAPGAPRHTVLLAQRPTVRGAVAPLGRLRCPVACGRVTLVAHAGGRIAGRAAFRTTARRQRLHLRLTRHGRRHLRAPASRLRARLVVVVRSPDGPLVRRVHAVVLRRGR